MMREHLLRGIAAAMAPSIVVVACGGSEASNPTDAGRDVGTGVSCVPGQSIACVSQARCSGAQVCNQDGSAYGPCVCFDGGVSDAGGDVSGQDAVSDAPPVDAGDAMPDASDAGSTWTPAQLPNLVLWLNADVGVTLDNNGNVTGWADQSGHGNDAAPPSPMGRPAFMASYVHKHGALHFSNCCGDTLWVTDAPTLQFGKGAFAVAAVAQGGGGAFLWDKTTNLSRIRWELNPGMNNQVPSVASTLTASVMATWLAGSFSYASLRGPALEMRVNGVATTGQTSTDDISSPGQVVSISAASGDLYITEILAVKGAMSDPDLAQLEAYFKAKFAL
jgi:hypothetical protein